MASRFQATIHPMGRKGIPKRVGGERRSAAEFFMTPRSNKLLGLETTDILRPVKPAGQRHSTSASRFPLSVVANAGMSPGNAVVLMERSLPLSE